MKPITTSVGCEHYDDILECLPGYAQKRFLGIILFQDSHEQLNQIAIFLPDGPGLEAQTLRFDKSERTHYFKGANMAELMAEIGKHLHECCQ